MHAELEAKWGHGPTQPRVLGKRGQASVQFCAPAPPAIGRPWTTDPTNAATATATGTDPAEPTEAATTED